MTIAALAVLNNQSVPFIPTISPDNVFVVSSGIGYVVTTNSCTVSPNGGTAPYTYSWTYHSGDVTFSATAATAATTAFSTTMTAFGQTKEAIWKCTVTDAGATVGVAYVSVFAMEFTYSGF